MVDFWVYDIILMVAFTGFIAWFLSTRKKDLSREGIMFMWRTKFGVKAIKNLGDKHRKFLSFLQPLIISIGFILMSSVLWMLGQTVSLYIFNPEITNLIKAPPIAPLIPYFPKLFGMESLFPPFYFTYFILALAIVAIVHEFSHGVFMRAFKIKIKATGLVFLGPILGAFVEQNDKSMQSKKNSHQMTVLGAGVFANVIFALIFYILYVLFFFAAFTPVGYQFNSYGVALVPTSNITAITNHSSGMLQVTASENNYYLDESMIYQLQKNQGLIYAYPEAPAVLSQMKGAIIMADDVKIIGQDSLIKFLQNKEPGDNITFILEDDNEQKEYEVTLSSHPENSSKAYLGVGNIPPSSKGLIRKTLSKFMSFKDSSVYYEPKSNGNFVIFMYNLFWWIMIINLLVAMFNMLPLGILDGGRFFYLAILSITKSEKVATWFYKAAKYIILAGLLAMMISWTIGRF